MSGLTQEAINKRFKTYNQDEFKTAEILTRQGLRTYNLIPAKLAFKWLMRDNPDRETKQKISCNLGVLKHRCRNFS